jgi:hypothetical protein
MSLWSLQKGQVRRRDLCGSLRGMDCFLCCPGPSLADLRPASLHVSGAVVIAVNTAYPRVRPDVWIGMDRPECYAGSLLWEPFLKVMGSRYASDVCAGGKLADCPNVCFASGAPGRPHEIFDRLAPESLLVWNGNTFQTALHLAFWLGCKRVNLVGCDFGGTRDYHDGRALADEHRARNRLLYRQLVEELPLVRLEAERSGRSIVSCTPDSPANEYLPFERLELAIERAAQGRPRQPEGPPLDAADAELCRWGKLQCEGPGVMTGCDAAAEWMLPWWWENYRRTNDYPVAFADLGMSSRARAWCSLRGRVVDVPRGRAGGWFAKPLAILRSPFRWTLWLDLDCQVRANLGEAFAYADRGLAVTVDPYYPAVRGDARGDARGMGVRGMGVSPMCSTGILPVSVSSSSVSPSSSSGSSSPSLSSGVVAVRHGEPAAQAWAAQVMRRLDRLRDDQAALEEIREACRDRIVLMPRRFQHLRLDAADNPEALVMHWTGPEGKRRIRQLMACGCSGACPPGADLAGAGLRAGA